MLSIFKNAFTLNLGGPILLDIITVSAKRFAHSLVLFPANRSSHSQMCNVIKKIFQYRWFPVNIAKFLRADFFIEHLRWLLLSKTFSEFFAQNPYFLISNYFSENEKPTRLQEVLISSEVFHTNTFKEYSRLKLSTYQGLISLIFSQLWQVQASLNNILLRTKSN